MRLLQAIGIEQPESFTHIAPNLIEAEALFEHLILKQDTNSSLGSTVLDVSSHLQDYYIRDIDKWCGSASTRFLRGLKHWQWLDTTTLSRMAALLSVVDSVWVKAGSRGVIHLQRLLDYPIDPIASTAFVEATREGFLCLSLFDPPVISEKEIVSTTGAGDTLVGALVAGLVSGNDEELFVQQATEAAGRTMRSIRVVS